MVFPYGFSYGFPLGSFAAEVFGMVFAASNIARLLLPLRFGAALAMAPWVDENIMRRGSPGEPCPGQGMGWPQTGGFTQEKWWRMMTGCWWLEHFLMFPNSWDDPIWLIFFRGVEPTNWTSFPPKKCDEPDWNEDWTFKNQLGIAKNNLIYPIKVCIYPNSFRIFFPKIRVFPTKSQPTQQE